MEKDDKKKRKNKNKKKKNNNNNNQQPKDDTAGETSSVGGDPDDTNNACASVDTDEKQRWLQEEARLRDMVKKLLYEKDSYIRTQSDLEMTIKQLQSENDSWHQKEVMLKQRITQLLQEKDTLSFEERNLQEKCQHMEKEKHFLAEKENMSDEVISNMKNENTRLKTQVEELEGAKESLSKENKVLLENMSTWQSRVQDLEMSLGSALTSLDAQKDASEKKLNTEMEEAYALIGKLMTENADLVEKVNALIMELGERDPAGDATSVDIIEYSTSGPVSRSTNGSQEDVPWSTKSANPFGTVGLGDDQTVIDEMDSDYASVVRHSSDTTLSGEIVQISLDESESRDLELQQSSVISGEENVPLVDAPLIGAPFRFISFVANYVSGADLVDKDAAK